MKHVTTYLFYLCIIYVLGCGIKPDDSRRNNKRSNELDKNNLEKQNTNQNATQQKAPIKVTLEKIYTLLESDKDLEFSTDSRLLLDGEILHHLAPEGLSSSFNFIENAWGLTYQNEKVLNTLYNASLSDKGWISIFGKEISYLDLRENALESFDIPFELTEKSQILAILIGKILLRHDNTTYLFSYSGKKTSLETHPEVSYSVKGAGTCSSTCDLWVWDGANFYTLILKEKKFTKQSFKITLEEDQQDIFNITGTLDFVDGQFSIGKIFAIDTAYNLYASKKISQNAEANWPSVLALSQTYCMPCHQDDGFDKKDVWTSLKDDIIRRIAIATKDQSYAMPTFGTRYEKEFSDTNRTLIIDWLNTEEKTQGGTFGGGGSTDTNTPLTGRLKTLSDNYCKTCHQQATTQEFWKARKQDATTRVESGNMPPSSNLPSADKAELINLLKAL